VPIHVVQDRAATCESYENKPQGEEGGLIDKIVDEVSESGDDRRLEDEHV